MPAFKPVVIITTAAGREEAERIGRALLERKLKPSEINIRGL